MAACARLLWFACWLGRSATPRLETLDVVFEFLNLHTQIAQVLVMLFLCAAFCMKAIVLRAQHGHLLFQDAMLGIDILAGA